MRRTELLQEIRLMRFTEAYEGWQEGRLTQEEAARLLGVCERSFRRYLDRFDDAGLEGLIDKRLAQASQRRAPVDEVLAVAELYQGRYQGWNVKHFYNWYQREHKGSRSYNWVRKTLQAQGLVARAKKHGAHRKRREPKPLMEQLAIRLGCPKALHSHSAKSPKYGDLSRWLTTAKSLVMPGMMLHQDGSTHEWIPDQIWDLIVTMDDADNEHYSMFFVDEEGTQSSFQGVKEVIGTHGLMKLLAIRLRLTKASAKSLVMFGSFYSDRGSHYWNTPEAGGKVDKVNLTQFGRAMKQLGIEMIAAYSPEARGRSERAFRTHQERLPKELALAGITDMAAANRYLDKTYRPAFNAEFMRPATEEGSAFVPWIGGALDDILCEQFERVVGNDNCVRFENLVLQIPADRHRCHYVKARVRVHRYQDGRMAIFHGPRKLVVYDASGKPLKAAGQALKIRLKKRIAA